MSAFENLPPLIIPKKRRADEIPQLEADKERLGNEAKTVRKRLRAHGSFNAEYWNTAAEIETKILEKTRVTSVISVSEFAGEESEWVTSEPARKLFAQMRAQGRRIQSFNSQSEALSLVKPRRGLREAFMSMFTSSTMGLEVNSTGMGKRDPKIQSKFRTQLLRDYDSLDANDTDYAWCPIMHEYLPKDSVTASHIFSYRHSQAMMDSIFGPIRPVELFSSKNGLIMCKNIEQYFDAGIFVIVPDMPEKPAKDILFGWLKKEVRTYKVRIIDHGWGKLDHGILCREKGLRWRDLDNRPLVFKSDQRPAARYLYFHYCLQVLRRAWKAGPGQGAAFVLQDELGKPIWATPGRYIAKNMLSAFAEELGHEHHRELFVGAGCKRGDSRVLFDIAVNQIADKEENDSDDVDEDDDEDEDEEDV